MQIDWQKGEWQCVRMVVDQLLNQVVELSKQLQDARRNYSNALKKSSDKDEVISRLHGKASELKFKNDVMAVYIETLEHGLIDRGVSQEELDDIYQKIEWGCSGGDD